MLRHQGVCIFVNQCGIKTHFNKVRSMVFYMLQCKYKGVDLTKYVANYFLKLSLDFSK